jgi:hypothetical protein
MSFHHFPTSDLLATITSAFDIKNSSEERPAGCSSLIESAPQSEVFDNNMDKTVDNAATGSAGDSSAFSNGMHCSNSNSADGNFHSEVKYPQFPPQNGNLMFHGADGTQAHGSEMGTFWTDATSIHHYSHGAQVRDSSRKEPAKSQHNVKQRFGQTVILLKKSNLYDLTMRVADILKRNSQLQHEIESLASECGYCYHAPAY